MSALIAVAAAVAAGLLVYVALPRVLRALPRPVEDPPDYVGLGTRPFRLATACATLLALGIVAWRDPHPWLWWGLALALVPACAIDARTTFLPLRLTQAGWVGAGLGVLAAAVLSLDPGLLLRAAVGAVVLGALFWLAWRYNAVGFGDVRLMLAVGAVSAAHSWGLLAGGLVAGTLIGAGWAVARLVRGRHGPFPYGPSLLAGPFVALALLG